MNDIVRLDQVNVAPTARVHPNVQLGRNVVIEDFCVIGYPPKGSQSGELKTVVGDNTLIRSHSIVYAGSSIGANCQISHSVFIREHTQIGDGCSIGINVVIEHHCLIGARVRVQGQAGFCEHTVIEDDAWIGPRVLTTNVLHPTCDRAKECLAGPIIRNGAIVGGNVVLAPDIEVGERAFVAAGSTVTKSVEPQAIVFGNPAKKISKLADVRCKYDIVEGSPYSSRPAAQVPARIALVDLTAQHQSLKQELRLAIDRVIYNARFINGKEVQEFEQAFAAFCQAEHAVGVANGTEALRLALQAVGVGPGDEVIMPSHTFIATASAVLALQAKPVFADIEEVSFTVDPRGIARRINGKTKAIVAVHLYGHPAPMKEIVALARDNNLKLVEDAAQAHGAKIDGVSCGRWGDAAAFSFYPGKNLGAYGDAGCVVTNDSVLARQVRMLRDHGRSSKYSSQVVGGNYRLDTMQAAVLGVKLRHLAKWNQARVQWAGRYCEKLTGLPVRLPACEPGYEHVYHLFVIRTRERERLRDYLSSRGVDTGVHYPIPCHLQPALAFLGGRIGDLPLTEAAAGDILSLPMYPELGEELLERVIAGISSFFGAR